MTWVNFNIEHWTAWTPGLTTEQDWIHWANGGSAPENTGQQPDSSFIPAIQRRRFSRLSKMALMVAHQCSNTNHEIPSVFGSRHGELTRTRKLLTDVIDQQPLSPTAFSMSVHNTASGLNSILTGNKAPSTSIAAGEATLENCFMEAYSILKQGFHKKVLVVYADEPVPDDYTQFIEHEEQPIAAAFLVSLNDPRYHLMHASQLEAPTISEMPIFSFLRFLIGHVPNYQLNAEGSQWTWRYDG